ncbi:iron-containing alcohol dehydrogenase family protein [Flaviramulus sp. BrNp1-15]|uniref:iron-containing alcohol dehydrogenase family protein n=1 Tax=Flaviramulus sp. BrNp1-15 TaxID=2916754 RepID=UPI001EE7B685|nr:iron-containing alcohol dehydrogenase family protein [Flaviramulus sp. BrNp1-15]ULC58128.1 iron-containing alcohol dehydrogenase family protein [Flaviramulus sp. BrNp1-15]
MSYKNFPMVPRIIFGRGSLNQINEVLAPKRLSINAPFIFLIDDVFKSNIWLTSRIQLSYGDRIIFVSSKEEPKTSQVDELVEDIILTSKERPSGIIGIGGGTLLDLAKAVSIMLTNNGEAKDYQGWDLVKNPAIYHVGIPTISGTGAEVSRTTVLTGPEKKLGINSDFTPFDQVILDSELTKGVAKNQWFYTGMDCYIHCIESLTGTYLNAFSESYGNMALDLCKQVFLEDNLSEVDAQEKLMMASWHGGMSIVYSQVGVAHAMSYGLSYLLGTKHGIGNCIVFNHLEEFYPEGVKLFKKMIEKHNIVLPQGVCADLNDREFDTMINIALGLEPLWENALGKNWKKIMTPQKLKSLYQKM